MQMPLICCAIKLLQHVYICIGSKGMGTTAHVCIRIHPPSQNAKPSLMFAEKALLRLMQLADRFLMPECVDICAAALTPTVMLDLKSRLLAAN